MEEKLMGDIANIVKKIFPSEIQYKRVIKEIQLLRELDQKFYKVTLQNSALGLKIMVKSILVGNFFRLKQPMCALNNTHKNQRQTKHLFFLKFCLNLNFHLFILKCFVALLLLNQASQMEEIFQLMFQRLYGLHNFNLNQNMLQGTISAFTLNCLKVSSIFGIHKQVKLLQLEIIKIQEVSQFQTIGKFHLGYEYNLEDFLMMDSVDVFPARQIVENNQAQQRYLIISSVNMLNFEVTDQKKNLIKLIQWSLLQNLQNIKRKKEDNRTIIFQWKDPEDNKQVYPLQVLTFKKSLPQQHFQLEDSQQIIELIIKYMKQSGVKIQKNVVKRPDLTMDDVTGKKDFDGLNIALLMENISILESQMQVQLSLDNINTLMSLYQKAIEYFSALNDETYLNYINRLQELLQNPGVQIVLESKTEETNKNKQNIKNKEEEKLEEDQNFQISSNNEDKQTENIQQMQKEIKAEVIKKETKEKEEEIYIKEQNKEELDKETKEEEINQKEAKEELANEKINKEEINKEEINKEQITKEETKEEEHKAQTKEEQLTKETKEDKK